MEHGRQPNILLIVADDLGFSDIAPFGAEIATPALSSLSEAGVRLLNYHTAAACSPTRAMIMSGTDAHLGGLGCLLEYKCDEQGQKRWNGKAGHEGFLNYEVAALPEVLQDNGYYTFMSGKWHLGLRPEHGPHARGFSRSFAMLPGCCNHYGWEPVLDAGEAGNKVGGRPIHAEDGAYVKIPANTTNDSKGFYSSDYYADKFIEYLDDRPKDKPWFGYLAFTAPHWPLQAPKEVRDKYKGMYDCGPDVLRTVRLERLKGLGIIPKDVRPHEVVAPEVSPWSELSDYERACSARAMETYAGMVECMDTAIGRVFEHLKSIGEWDNTLVVFMSDNGAEGAAIEAIPVLGENMREAIEKYYDNSLDNIGEWNSYTWLGPLWAQASTAPSRLYKCYPSEGGILVPAIVKPARGTMSNMEPGSMSRAFTTCMDLAPTVLDLADVTLPPVPEGHRDPQQRDDEVASVEFGKQPNHTSATAMAVAQVPGRGRVLHRGREVYAMTGKSWVPWFGRGKAAEDEEQWAVYPSTEPMGWELQAMAALRLGDWKIVHLRATHGGRAHSWREGRDDPKGWELFNIASDPGETEDVSDRYPEKMAELLHHWEAYCQEFGLVWGEHALDDGLSQDEAELWHDYDPEMQRGWIMTKEGGQPRFSKAGVE